jgi:hypothetical protein
MLDNLRQIHPHARLWIVSAIVLALVLMLKEPATFIVKPPHGKVIA